jgi:riboflavin kinase/FMN adenylyltransferase
MAIFHYLDKLPVFRKPVLTIGSFDGVHHGHRVILEKVVSLAKAIHGESILITFDPHPRKIIHPEQPLGLLSAPEEKMKLITALGIDHIVVVPFTRDFSMLSAKEYVFDFLVKKFHPHTIVLGYDHHFGHNREGDIEHLKAWIGDKVNIAEIPAQLIDEASVNSTKIRKALLEGKVAEAAIMLERPFSFAATVIHGEQLGRVLGYPTANLRLDCPDMLLPKAAIYAVFVEYEGKLFKGMMSIGYRLTVAENGPLSIEVNILDFSAAIYGQTLKIYFMEYIREEENLPSLKALQEKLKEDEKITRELLIDRTPVSWDVREGS